MTVRGILFLILESVHMIQDVTRFAITIRAEAVVAGGPKALFGGKESWLHLVTNLEETETSSGRLHHG